ncbi:hypothetical protein Rsub_01766 [Raphidocelis subcapitata]|uniref:Nucleotide-diphospho-sugar transferase domain-containing protein n=1 Tax=Raphidocelis subcapitata TaxID=307507 RepID=A0A2V0NP50_9CHLO|nr:hypothetical protein Rsub_01766 [Raphidocelis subcapitata]|eukprot:GBF89049.1 hypothetical protein Rsub_01766 [Raphidocelis subcapitata]
MPRPNAACDLLTPGLLAHASRNGTVMLLVVDWESAEPLLPHWLGNARAAGVDYFLVAAADARTALALGRAGLGDRCYLLPSDAQRQAPPGGGRIGYYWGSEEWVAATWRKVAALEALMAAHPVDVLLSDVDVVWLADPLPFMRAHPAASILVSLDTPGSWTPPGDGGLEHDFQWGRVCNTGALFARHQPGVLGFLRAWRAAVNATRSDQDVFNALLREGARREAEAARVSEAETLRFAAEDANRTLACALNCTIRIGHLPAARFLNSYTFSMARLHEAKGVAPIACHLVWGYGGQAAKLAKVRDEGWGYDGPEYLDPPALLSFDLAVPPEPPGFSSWADPGEPGGNATAAKLGVLAMADAHASSLDAQLSQLWHAAGAAVALNRTLLLPQLRCLCARGWHATDRCRLAGDNATSLPVNCSLDQVFVVEALVEPLEAVDGARLSVREVGFGRNWGRLPAALLASRALVTMAGAEAGCSNGTVDGGNSSTSGSSGGGGAGDSSMQGAACTSAVPLSGEQQAEAAAAGVGADYGLPPPPLRIALPRGGLTSDQLRAALAPHASVRWLHLASDPRDVFGGFSRPEAAAAFQRLMDRAAAAWCCRDPKREGGDRADGHFLRPRRWPGGGGGGRGNGSAAALCRARRGGVEVDYFCTPGDAPPAEP